MAPQGGVGRVQLGVYLILVGLGSRVGWVGFSLIYNVFLAKRAAQQDSPLGILLSSPFRMKIQQT